PREEDALAANARVLERWRADPEHAVRLENDLRAFRKMPKPRRDMLRKLDRDLHRLPQGRQKQLRRVLERYHAWLKRLPQAHRGRAEAARDWRERLRIAKELRQREWVRRLPPPVRKALKDLKSDERKKKIEQLRKDWQRRHRGPGGGR